MLVRSGRLGTFLLIVVLFSLLSLAASTGAQSQAFNQRNELPDLPRKTSTLTSPNSTTKPSYSVLYNFCEVEQGTICLDGMTPYFSGLIADSAGNMYGTTFVGGTIANGTVFELIPPPKPGGAWTEVVLYSFCSAPGCTDGASPTSGVIRDAAGNLYGTTIVGGANGYSKGGTVFKVDNTGTMTVLYSFCSEVNCADGYYPVAGLIQDAMGNLYGTTEYGGANNDGTVFELLPPTQPGGAWTEAVLYSFCSVAPDCTDGEFPSASLIQDAAGNLYGTTKEGGPNDGGDVFKLAPPAQMGDPWTERVLYSFGPGKGGEYPLAGLTKDAAGDLYGTTSSPDGAVFKLDSSGQFTVLYSFCSVLKCKDGYGPAATLIQDGAGNLYGTTYYGGAHSSVNSGNVVGRRSS